MSKYYCMQRAGEIGEVYIFGDLTADRWFENETSADSFRRELQELGPVSELRVHIDSYGGSVSEGWAIYNILREQKGKVITYGDGFVASAALYPFLAGQERIASSVSAYYLHCVMMAAAGYAEDLRAAADEADFMTNVGINAFTEATGIDPETIRALMEQETWLSPQDALELGIATAITRAEDAGQSQSARRQIFQRMLEPKAADPEPEQKDPDPKPEQKAPEPERNGLLELIRGL